MAPARARGERIPARRRRAGPPTRARSPSGGRLARRRVPLHRRRRERRGRAQPPDPDRRHTAGHLGADQRRGSATGLRRRRADRARPQRRRGLGRRRLGVPPGQREVDALRRRVRRARARRAPGRLPLTRRGGEHGAVPDPQIHPGRARVEPRCRRRSPRWRRRDAVPRRSARSGAAGSSCGSPARASIAAPSRCGSTARRRAGSTSRAACSPSGRCAAATRDAPRCGCGRAARSAGRSPIRAGASPGA